MSSRTQLYREVYRLIEQKLCALGMRKYDQGIYGRDLTADARGMVGLNVATKYGFSINPLIGVQYLPLERVLGELKGREFHPTKCGNSITKAIGYLGLAHRFREWDFEEGRDNVATVDEMAGEITTIGFRYMEENCTLEKVCERIAVDRHFMMGNDVYQLPVGYMMLGRFDDAERIVRKHLADLVAFRPPTIEETEARLGERFTPRDLEVLAKMEHKPVDDDYRRFAERFFRRLEDERSQAHGLVGK